VINIMDYLPAMSPRLLVVLCSTKPFATRC
jgi:hypothetical protein